MTEEKENALKALRKTLGLSVQELADNLGVNRNTLRRWESGTAFPQTRYIKKLQDIFYDELPQNNRRKLTKEFYELDEQRLKAFARSRAAIQHTFTEGICYSITEKNITYDGNILEKAVLRYEGKKGIHHFFREVVGKWIVTYTDAQLIGKHIKEVDEHGNSKA